jgi:hypothetical protein
MEDGRLLIVMWPLAMFAVAILHTRHKHHCTDSYGLCFLSIVINVT